MNPEVSVIIPTYNSEKYIAQALKSVLAQTYRNLEIILVDDGSTDITLKIARSFLDRRLRIIKNDRNRGVSYSRNRAIVAAQGKWIALLDSDDWYAPQRIEKLLEVAEDRGADLVADDLFLVRDNEQQHWSTLLEENSAQMSPLSLIDAVQFVISDRPAAINAKRSWSLGYAKPLIRREFLQQHNIWYDEKVDVGEDFTLYLECLRQRAQFYLLAQPYYYYRNRASSLSARKPTTYLSQSCSIIQGFINRAVYSRAEGPLIQALQQNLVSMQQRLDYYQAIESIKNRNLIEAIQQIRASPQVMSDLYERSIAVLRYKLAIGARIKNAKESNYTRSQPVTNTN